MNPLKLNELMKQAQQLQEKMQQAQKELDNKIVIGESGGGLVKIEMLGRKIKDGGVHIKPELLKEELPIIEDLLAAAINDALRKKESESGALMEKFASGIDMPPEFKLPFGDDK